MKKDLLNLAELELPEENLSKDQIKRIRASVNKTINKYESSCYKTFDNEKVDNEAILNPRNEKIINGVENTEVLKSIVLPNLDKITVYEGELLYKRLFKSGVNTSLEAGGINGMAFNLLNGTTCYFYVFITTKQIIFHFLDNYFRLIKTKTYNKEEIEYFKGYFESRSMCIVSNREVKKDYIVLCRDYDFKKGEIEKVCMILKGLGIKDETKEKTMAEQVDSKVNKISLIITIPVILLVIWIIIRIFILK